MRTLTIVVVALAAYLARADDDPAMFQAREHQTAVDMLTDQMMQRMNEIEVEYYNKKLPMYQKRNEVLRTVKNFWTRVIENHPAHHSWLFGQDKEILQYLQDIVVADNDPARTTHDNAYRISFVFEPNPFFSNTHLFREIRNTIEDEHSSASGVAWHEGKEPYQPTFFSFFENSQVRDQKPHHLEPHILNDIAHIVRYEFWTNPFTYYDMPSMYEYQHHDGPESQEAYEHAEYQTQMEYADHAEPSPDIEGAAETTETGADAQPQDENLVGDAQSRDAADASESAAAESDASEKSDSAEEPRGDRNDDI